MRFLVGYMCLWVTTVCPYSITTHSRGPSDDDDEFSSPTTTKGKFLWGVATAAYQIEGAAREDGRGASIWDTFSSLPGKIRNNDQGTVADDSYHKVKEDLDLIGGMGGVNSYRFSISWSRLLPEGSLGSPVNHAAIDHYNRLLDGLFARGIEPLVTMYHWDLPQALEDRYGGWLSDEIERDFVAYADLCFASFPRVKMWATLNEPWTFALMGYVAGIFAPGRCSDRSRCSLGNSSTEGYLVAHNALNAHAAAVELYRAKYQEQQKGEIGIVLNHDWAEPLSGSDGDRAAATRRNEFAMGWFLDPLVFGRYPATMVELVGDRLPKFTPEQSQRLTGSFDFLGINHYSTKYYTSAAPTTGPSNGWSDDQHTRETKYSEYGFLIGPQAASPWLNVVPWGFYKMLKWNSERATVRGTKPRIFVTENGCDVPNESSMPLAEALQDSFRVSYYRQYLEQLDRAKKAGVDIRGVCVCVCMCRCCLSFLFLSCSSSLPSYSLLSSPLYPPPSPPV